MASDFSVFVHRNEENIHLKLNGELNGPSAYQLIDILDRHCGNSKKIFIHTGGLSNMHSFALELIKEKYSRYTHLVFTGNPGNELSPKIDRYVS